MVRDNPLEDDPLWYKDAVIYEVHVRTFADSDGDGIGDFRGLIEKLDYLADLGVTAVWLLPFYPSPLKDDGYDIADYFSVHPAYGTLRDFKDFLKEAHQRGMRIITELVLNHTSDQHPWFQRARASKPGSRWRDFYVWSDTSERYQDARIIFKDFEPSNWSWDRVAKAYYWHRFYSHQPDLNFRSPHTERAVFRVLDFWLGMGVDGLRLDAVPYLFEREDTNCENLPETYEFLRKLRAYVDGKYKNRMLLAEANQWPEDAARYFGDGDGCQMAFHFPLMPRMFMSIEMEDRFPTVDVLEQTPPVPETCQWAMFLRNHDELTLEMVTDEERDYMYRVYARDPRARLNLGIRRRLAPLINNMRSKAELMNVMLFSMPGTPIIYYGDEIGMGDNYYLGDRNGVRTPMQWSPDRNAGFSTANPQRLYLPVIIDPEYHYEAVNVETMQANTGSLLWWMKRMLAMRKRFKAFGRGAMEFVPPENPKVMAFVRKWEDELVLVALNLSRHSQAAELDLAKYAGSIPEDVFSQNEFPAVRETPYALTLGPYGYYVFLLKQAEEPMAAESLTVREIKVSGRWQRVLEGRARERLERDVLPLYLREQRWFRSKAQRIAKVGIGENIAMPDADASLLLLDVQYTDGTPETYVLPVAFCHLPPEAAEPEGVLPAERGASLMEETPQAVIARLRVEGKPGVLYDGMYKGAFRDGLFRTMMRRHRVRGRQGELRAYHGGVFRKLMQGHRDVLSSQVLGVDQTNTSALYAETFFFKLFRRLETGMNPDPEIVRFLTEKTRFRNIPLFAGAVEYHRKDMEPAVLGLLQAQVPNEGDEWSHMLHAVARYFEQVIAVKPDPALAQAPPSLLDRDFSTVPPVLQELIGGLHPEKVDILGRRTAELHLALASARDDPAFVPEPFSMLWQRSLYQTMRSQARRVFASFSRNIKRLPERVRPRAEEVLAREQEITGRFGRLLAKKFDAVKTRIHGDYHLGQVLDIGKDFVIIDFEGEPARALSERRLKRSPLVDVAGMVRSFHYAAFFALFQHETLRPEDIPELEPWVERWYHTISGIFLSAYLEAAGDAPFVPRDRGDLETLLQAFLLDKAVYELGYELNNRPDWLVIPIKGINDILSRESGV
jgi:maltose alpha-D-glucosyltransferase/alpha-amylase